jgi:hypothetical protein
MNDVFYRIGIHKNRDEEIFLADYESDVDGLTDYLGEWESLSALNWLAAELMRSDVDLETFSAALELGDYCDSPLSMIELARGLDNFILLRDVHTDEELGEYYVEEGLSGFDTDSPLFRYFDAEAYGRDIRLDSYGTYSRFGFVECIDDHFEAVRWDDIPDEYRIYITD